MTAEQNFMLISMIFYLLFVLYIGIRCSKKNNNVDDFYLGGRRLGPFVTAMSAEASDMSSWLLMGVPGLAYLTGLCDAGWTAIGLAVGTYVNWLLVAKRLRDYSQVCGAITVPDFFSKRYGDKKYVLSSISAIVIIIFFIPYTASGFAACGKLFESFFGVDYHIAMVISAVVIVGYTCSGGFLAASMTDLVQSIIMSIALLIILVFGVHTAGGISTVIDNADHFPGFLSMSSTYDPKTGQALPYEFLKIVSTCSWGLGYFGMPHILLRFMATENSDKIKISRRVASVWVVISLAAAVFIGIIGFDLSKSGIIKSLSESNSETVIVRIANLLGGSGPVFALIAGVVLAGILASTMSTSDSQLLAASSSVSENLISQAFGINLSDVQKMFTARGTVVLISILGIILAWNPDSSIFQIVAFAWAGFGAAFGPAMLYALFWRRSNKWGAFAGMISGGTMVFLWKYLIAPLGGVFAIYELFPSFIVACIVNAVVSLMTKAPDQEILDEFDKVGNN